MKSITSASHDLVKHWVLLQKDKRYRQVSGHVLVEGKNLLQDLLKRHTPKRLILTEQHRSLSQEPPCEVVCITDTIASKISCVENPEGYFAEMPFSIAPAVQHPLSNRALILDRLQDPGNVGTLLRTALAFDIRTIYLISPSCDPWNSKAIRAAKGAQFDLSLSICGWKDIPGHVPLFVADMHGENVAHIPHPSSWLLALGNEAHGPDIPAEIKKRRVKVPMTGPMESLNVAQAGAILLYSFTSS